MDTIRLPVCDLGIKRHKIEPVSFRTITDFQKAYLSAITATNIYKSFTYKMAAEISWHRYGTKLRHCHLMYAGHKMRAIFRTRVSCDARYRMIPQM